MKNRTVLIGGHDKDGNFVEQVRCELTPQGVEISGSDSKFIEELKLGVEDGYDELKKPEDGLAFLYALLDTYKNPYLLAIEEKE